MSKYKEFFEKVMDFLSKKDVCDFFYCTGNCPLKNLGSECISVKWTKEQWAEYFMKEGEND